MDLETFSRTVAGTDGTTWFKITLDKIHCVKTVIRYGSTGDPYQTWTCSKEDCSNCVGGYRSAYTLTVSTEGAVSNLSPVPDCKYGDTVKLERIDGGSAFGVYELAVTGKQGNVNVKHQLTGNIEEHDTDCIQRQFFLKCLY